jgi:nucleoside-diphosphate-sugar epimerase
VLVTGHTGFKGAWLSSWLLADGVETAGLALVKADVGRGWRPLLGFSATVALTANRYKAYAAEPTLARRRVDDQIAGYRHRL